MSGYRYATSPAERKAAKLLRDKGWQVQEPQCPECHGNGFVYEVKTTGDRIFGSSTASTRLCSLGCPTSVAFYFAPSQVLV